MKRVLHLESLPGEVLLMIKAKSTTKTLLIEMPFTPEEAEQAAQELLDAARDARMATRHFTFPPS